MPFIPPSKAKTFALGNTTFTSLASPSRGAIRNAVWIVHLEGNEPGRPHQVSEEETFVVLEGRAQATLGKERYILTPGSALVVTPRTDFSLANIGETPFKAVVVLPVGAQAIVDGNSFVPPWAA